MADRRRTGRRAFLSTSSMSTSEAAAVLGVSSTTVLRRGGFQGDARKQDLKGAGHEAGSTAAGPMYRWDPARIERAALSEASRRNSVPLDEDSWHAAVKEYEQQVKDHGRAGLKRPQLAMKSWRDIVKTGRRESLSNPPDRLRENARRKAFLDAMNEMIQNAPVRLFTRTIPELLFKAGHPWADALDEFQEDLEEDRRILNELLNAQGSQGEVDMFREVVEEFPKEFSQWWVPAKVKATRPGSRGGA